MYHKKNVDFAYLLWEDFVYQVEHKDARKRNEIYYPRFIKIIINFFIIKDPSIPRRNKVNWHYVRDDQMFMTIKLVSRNQNTHQFGAVLPIELTNEDIRNSAAYKEDYAIASGAAPPKMKASVRKTQSSSNTTMPPPMTADTRLLTSAKRKQSIKSSNAKEVPDVLTDESDEEISWKSSDKDDDDVDDQNSNNDDDDFVHPKLSTHDEEAKDEESFDPIVQTPSQVENSNDESNDGKSHGMNIRGDEGPDSSFVSSQFIMSMFNPSPDVSIGSLYESTTWVDVPVTTTVVPLLVTSPTLPPPSIPIMLQVQQAPAPTPTTAPSTSL
nr:hypothetical protein [Tanacetum cinerariifolium]